MLEKDIIELFCIINAFKMLEPKKGNEYERAYIKVKYLEQMIITEYINIFNLIRVPTFYEFVKYFWTFEKRMSQQSNDTDPKINDYLWQSEEISQKIIIIMVFEIKSTKIEIDNKAKFLLESIKINEMDKEIFTILKKEKWD